MPKNTINASLATVSLAILIGIALSIVARETLSSLCLYSRKTGDSDPTSVVPVTPLVHLPMLSEPQKVRILSYDPFIAHIENFLSPIEREHVIKLSQPLLSRSTVLFQNGSQSLSESRTSSTAYLPSNDFILDNIRRRAAEFQGYLPKHSVDLQVTSYQPGQQYKAHYDWFQGKNLTRNRLSTFFAILDADCESCGTQFPNINITWSRKDPSWCRFMDCSKGVLTSKNVNGSAIFWRNLDQNGKGRNDVLHAGLPAISGRKVGLNIWTDVDVAPYAQP